MSSSHEFLGSTFPGTSRQPEILIVGGGPAGISAALWVKRLGVEPLLIEAKDRLGGQLLRTYNTLIDCPGFFGLTGGEAAERLTDHLAALDVQVRLNSPVTRLDLAEKTVECGETRFQARGIILALGVVKRRLGIPGEKEFAGRGVSTSATRDAPRYAGKPVAIVGGGDGAFEEALTLAAAGCRVTLIHRSDRYRARPMYRDPVLADPRIEVLPFTHIRRIDGGETVSAIEIETTAPEHRAGVRTLDVAGVFLTLGVRPATDLVAGRLELDGDGFIVTDRHGATSVPGVWAAGDACNPLLPSLSTAFGDGATAGAAAFQWLNRVL